MRCWRFLFFLVLALSPLLVPAQQENGDHVVVLDIDGAIGPATADYVKRGLDRARDSGARLVVLRMDTPGGLDKAMREIVQDILASPVPVASFVAPGGARAASAGTYILYASHIAAMAPATNLGAATPVQIGASPAKPDKLPGDTSDKKKDKKKDKDKDKDGEKSADPEDSAADKSDAMSRKMVNDAVAYIRGLARKHGRNEQWAEEAVREAASLPAEDAVEQKVVDLVARDVGDLLEKIHGRKITVLGEEITLDTDGVQVVTIGPDWRHRFLSVITDPNILVLLMSLGMAGITWELINPGALLPGVLGGICLLLALYGAQVLPVNYAGMALIVLGIAFMIGEAFAPSFGVLGIGGTIAFVIGAIILMDTEAPNFGVSLPLIITLAVVNALVFGGIATMAVKAQKREVVSGREQMMGGLGVALENFSGDGRVRIHSEDWNARSEGTLIKGQRVRVTAVDGLTLNVEPVNKTESES